MKNIFYVLAFFCFISNSSRAQDVNDSSPWFFIQITDTQFGMFNHNKSFEKETELYERAVKDINRLKPDFVVVTGDLLNKPDSREQIAEFKRITAKIDPAIPVYVLPGNHDVNNEPDNTSIKSYLQNYGYQWFSFNHKGSAFMGINSQVIKAGPGKYEKKQFKFLKKELKRAGEARHLVVFCHYPFFNDDFNEEESYSNIGTEDRTKYLEMFAEHGVDAVFAGHLHDNRIASYKNIQMITTNAIGKPLGEAPSGFRVVKVTNGKLESVYYGLDEVPEKISLNR